MLSGGELIDEGSYGCIFTPSLECKNKNKQRIIKKNKELKVSKLILTPFAKKEDAVSTLIRKIPLWKNYFVVSETMCEPAASQKDKDIDTCNVIKNHKMSEFRLLFMPYGGQPLNIHRFILQEFDFIEFSKHLIAGGAILNLFGIIHRDIHSGNILMDQDHVPRIIDFNLAIFKEHSDFNIYLSHQYNVQLSQEPPDSTLINAVKQGYNADSVISSIIQKKHIIKKIGTLLQVPLDQMQQDLEDFYHKSKSLQESDDLKWFKTYWRTIDSWAIGVILVDLIYKLSMWPDFSDSMDKIKDKLHPVLRGLCAVSPLDRIDCVQALQLLDPQHFVIRKYGSAWLEKVGTAIV